MKPILTASLLASVLALLAQPAPAQNAATACANEAERLSEAFGIDMGQGKAAAALAEAPGARKGAQLGEEQRHEVGRLVKQAREAGQRGDQAGCLERLAEARAMLRQAGLGGGAGVANTGPGTAGSSIGAGTSGTGGIGGTGAAATGTGAAGAAPRGMGAGDADGLNSAAERARSGGGTLGSPGAAGGLGGGGVSGGGGTGGSGGGSGS
jgi:hypothetical protein